ncbi:HEAT repeat domain-containing protein [Synechococcus sp. PCC 7336]|uniref:HEAT repeat domain-containing protein n=1 Tax=Synechococcus sp. PCC 7336 TaxID=195250 RepID=UPI00034B6BD5|nr:HEAT repeat domain-containing protein [Synechococcus sp. PCC 7336]
MAVDLAALAAKLESDRPADRMVALAQLREVPDEQAVPLILKVVGDDLQQVRSFAVFALGVKQTEASLPALIEILESDEDYGIRADAAGALGYLEDRRAYGPLVRAFYEDVEWLVRFSAAVALGNLKDERAFDLLLRALDEADGLMQQAAIAALGEIGDVRAVDRLLSFVQSEDWLVRQRLAQALGNLPTPKSRSALEYLTRDPQDTVATTALYALRELDRREANKALP